MKKYLLKTKCGEVINRISTDSLFNAIRYFAKRKDLSIKSLIALYDVKVVKTR